MEPFKNSEKRIITWKKSKFPPGKKIKNLVSFLNIFWETFHQSGGFKSDKRCQPWARNSVFLERKCSRTTIYREFWRSSTLPEHWVSAKNQGEPALKKNQKNVGWFLTGTLVHRESTTHISEKSAWTACEVIEVMKKMVEENTIKKSRCQIQENY